MAWTRMLTLATEMLLDQLPFYLEVVAQVTLAGYRLNIGVGKTTWLAGAYRSIKITIENRLRQQNVGSRGTILDWDDPREFADYENEGTFTNDQKEGKDESEIFCYPYRVTRK